MKASEFKALIKEEVKKALKESAMSDIDLMAKDAITFNAFAVEFFKEYPNIKQDEKMGFIKWLKTVYTDAKKNK
jgi:ATP-dependent Clp protease adapter protein ClpS